MVRYPINGTLLPYAHDVLLDVSKAKPRYRVRFTITLATNSQKSKRGLEGGKVKLSIHSLAPFCTQISSNISQKDLFAYGICLNPLENIVSVFTWRENWVKDFYDLGTLTH